MTYLARPQFMSFGACKPEPARQVMPAGPSASPESSDTECRRAKPGCTSCSPVAKRPLARIAQILVTLQGAPGEAWGLGLSESETCFGERRRRDRGSRRAQRGE